MSELPRIPGYRIVRKLGQGGMADVYLGVQENLQREVAIKVLVPSLFRDEQFAVRFIKEARTAAQLVHPNIITVHDVGKVQNTYFIVMEYLPESLHDRLKEKGGALEPDGALQIIKKIAGALDYAHKKGFIHRDIKPDNIMFRPDGAPVLVDFGIARAINATTQLTQTGMSIGTPHYMSPEQCRGEKIDGRSDLYSLGVELFELLTGNVPYKAENTAGIILKHIQEAIPRLPDHLAAYQPLLEKMMAKDKNQRVRNGDEVIHLVERFGSAPAETPPAAGVARPTSKEFPPSESPTIRTTPVPSSEGMSFRREPPKKRWVLPVILVTLILAGVTTVAYLLTRPGTEIDNTNNKDNAAVTAETHQQGEDNTGPGPDENKRDPVKDAAGGGEDSSNTGGDDSNATDPAGTDTAGTPGTDETTADQTHGDATQPDTTRPDITQPDTTQPAGGDKFVPDKAPEKSPEELNRERLEREYVAYINMAREYLEKGDYTRATANAAAAGRIKRTGELNRLEKEIRAKEDQAGKAKEAKQEKEKPKPKPKPVSYKDISVLQLHPDTLKAYNGKFQRLQARLRTARFKVGGTITLTLNIDEKGRVRIKNVDDNLIVEPAMQRRRVLGILKRKVTGIFLPPPKDKSGKTARLSNWRISFKVGKLLNKITLIKQ